MFTVVYQSVRDTVLSALRVTPTGHSGKSLPVTSRDGVDPILLQKHQLYTKVLTGRYSAVRHSTHTSSPVLLTPHMETLPPTEGGPPMEVSPSLLVKSQAGSTTSLTLSDSEEESGYMSCTSGGKKGRYSRDIENLLANHSDSSKSLNSSLNDVSSCEPNDSREHSQDDDIDDGDKSHQYVSYVSTSNVVLTKVTSLDTSSVTSLDTPSSPEPQQPVEQLEVKEEDSEREEEDESQDESSDDDKDEGTNQKAGSEEDIGDADEEEEVEEEEESGCEEDEEDEDEEHSIRKPLQRQTTVISQREDDDETTSCEEEEDKDIEFPDKKKKRKPRKASSSSSGTWVSDDDDKCVGVTAKDDDDSDGPDIGDFFDNMTDNVSYKFLELDSEEVSSYPSREFFSNGRSSPVFGPETMIKGATDDEEEDFGYIYSSDLKTGKRYAFPRREPRTISDAVDFWETDFEVKGSIYPSMSTWEEKSLVPTLAEDAEDHLKYLMYKCLYDKWMKCNRSTEQWSQRYWGRSIQHVARMKGAPKPPLSTPDCTVQDHSTTLPELSSVDQSVADRRRRRRNGTISVTRDMY